MLQKLEQDFQKLFNELGPEGQKQFTEVLGQITGNKEVDASIFSLKIKLEGENFHASVPADYAHALWKLQQACYKLAATILYGDPTASLTQEEKEKFLLVFSIEKGSTDSEASLLASFFALAESMVDKMEPWQTLALAALLCLTYLGAKGIDAYASHKDKTEETERKKIDAELQGRALETQAEVSKEAITSLREVVVEHSNAFTAAQQAGQAGRSAILKTVKGVTWAEIGARTYSAAQISEYKRRSPREKARSEVRDINVAVVKIGTEDKAYPKLTLQERGSNVQYSAEISPQTYEDENDYDNAMNIIWESARYPNRFFWAEASMVFRKDKLVECSILAVAKTKEELDSGYEEQD